MRCIPGASVLAVAAVLVGCLGGPDAADQAPPTACSEPRPEVCTREYRPVCARHRDGTWKTHATGCTACSNADVVGYRDGACEPGDE